jgi:hypothetical protein
VARTRRALSRTVREEARRQHVQLRRVGLGGNLRGHRLLLILGVCGLLLTPSAGGLSEVPGDPTPPVVTPLLFGTLGNNGWYVTNVTLNWRVEDPESQILETQGCDARTLVNDTVGTQFTCYARSDGGETTVTITIRLDKTAPAVTATPARAPDSNGWYNHSLAVSFSGTDGTSGIESCVPPQTYSGPDSQNASVSGSCRDRAGNTTVRAFALSYDATAPQVTGATPSRSPDRAGWYNHDLTISFAGTDATSGIESCTQVGYSGPDSANASVNGTCRDVAGNLSASSAYGFRYDETGPVVTATPARSPDSNGWYNHALSVTFSGTDATSGIDICVPPQIYSGPDSANASVSGNCRDVAGNTTVRAFGLSYDATAPQVTPVPERAYDANGWFNHPLRVVTDGVDATSGLDVCTLPQLYSGPDNENALVSGDCTDRAGNAGAGSIALRYDATGPIVAATPARAPDANGWYNHPLAVSFSGIDATSGIEACAHTTYSGPDSANASVSGTCNDRAGNATPAGFLLKYDATAPAIGMLVAKPGKRSVELFWRVSSDAVSVELARAPGTNGAERVIHEGATSATSHLDQGLKAGRTYRYRLSAADEAANRATRMVDFVARGALLFPAPGERVSKAPLLVWTPVKGARYYNVILMRGRRVFSAWPVRARLQLRRTWTYRGSRYKLRPGLYRWFVWPGRGRLAAGNYGPMLGGSTFIVSG